MKSKILTITLIVLLLISCLSCSSVKNSSTKNNNKKLDPIEQTKFEDCFFNALKHKSIGNDDEAYNTFKKCLEINPKCATCYYEMALLQINNKLKNNQINPFIKQIEILEAAEKAYNLNKNNLWYALFLAEIYTLNQLPNKAIKIYKEALKKYPSDKNLYTKIAMTYFYSLNYDKALEFFNQYESKFGIDKTVAYMKQQIWTLKKNYKMAILETENAIKAYPDDVTFYIVLAELYKITKQNEKALETYIKAAQIEPDNIKINLELLKYYYNQKDYEKFFMYTRNIIGSPNIDIDTKMEIMLNCYSLSENDSSLKNITYQLSDILINIHPEDPKAYSIKGDLLYRDKKYKDALTMFYNVVKFDSTKYVVWEHIILLEAELGYFEQLKKSTQTTIELFPAKPFPYLLNGIANNRLKNYDKAIESLLIGKDLVVDNNKLLGEFFYNLGEAYHYKNENEKSDEAFEKSLKYDSTNLIVMNNYSYYLSLRKEKLERAEYLSRKTIQMAPNQPSFLDTYAWIMFVMGKYEEALKWIEKAYQKGGSNNYIIVEHYGDILFKLNKLSDALIYWKKSLELGNDSPILKRKIETQNYIE